MRRIPSIVAAGLATAAMASTTPAPSSIELADAPAAKARSGKAPAFKMKDLDGRSASLATSRARPSSWWTWFCPTCLQRRFQSRNSVHSTGGSKAHGRHEEGRRERRLPPRRHLHRQDADVARGLVKDKEVVKQLDIEPLVLIDADTKVAAAYGEDHAPLRHRRRGHPPTTWATSATGRDQLRHQGRDRHQERLDRESRRDASVGCGVKIE